MRIYRSVSLIRNCNPINMQDIFQSWEGDLRILTLRTTHQDTKNQLSTLHTFDFLPLWKDKCMKCSFECLSIIYSFKSLTNTSHRTHLMDWESTGFNTGYSLLKMSYNNNFCIWCLPKSTLSIRCSMSINQRGRPHNFFLHYWGQVCNFECIISKSDHQRKLYTVKYCM